MLEIFTLKNLKKTKNINQLEDNMKVRKSLLMLFVVSLLFTASSVFLPAQENLTGLQVMEKVYNRPSPKELKANMTMILINSRGEKRVRKIVQYIKDFGSVEKKIMYFVSPADIKNTSFMNWSYDKEGKNDDQWIYLPALKRVKRISSDSKSDYFMGSDFTYDDLGNRKPVEDNHKLVREETFKGEECYVVESVPKDDDYMYSKTITWVIKGKWIGLKRDFYDEDGDYLKTLSIKKYDKIKGYWLILDAEIHNVQKNHKTEMMFSDLEIDSGIPDYMFTERMMRRGIK